MTIRAQDRIFIDVAKLLREGELDLLSSIDHLHECELRLCSKGELASKLKHYLQGLNSPYPAWAYLLYFKLGSWILSGGRDSLLSMQGIVTEAYRVQNISSITTQVIQFGDNNHVSPDLWSCLLSLFQEGGDFIEDLDPPDPEHFQYWQQKIRLSRLLIKDIDPELDYLMSRLQILVVAAQPGFASRNKHQTFGGATCFFFRGGTLINASSKPSIASITELLIHEYAHAELFVLGQEKPLCLNKDDELHNVLIRSDPRPMNGIIHSLYVTGRVAEFFAKSYKFKRACSRVSEEEASMIISRLLLLGDSSLSVVQKHGILTPFGEAIRAISRRRLLDAEKNT